MDVRILPEALSEWTDFDGASWRLAKCLGLMPDIPWNPGDRTKPGYGMKAAFWSSNLFGETLTRIMQELVRMGALEFDEDNIAYRWNTEFRWERAFERPDVSVRSPWSGRYP